MRFLCRCMINHFIADRLSSEEGNVCLPWVQSHQPNDVEHILESECCIYSLQTGHKSVLSGKTGHMCHRSQYMTWHQRENDCPLVINIFHNSISCFQFLYNIISLQQYFLDSDIKCICLKSSSLVSLRIYFLHVGPW